MDRLTTLGMAMVLLGVVTISEADPVRIDQMVRPHSGDHASVGQDILQAQTFTIGVSGTLSALDLYTGWFQVGGATVGPLLVDIRPTTNGVPILDNAAAFVSFSFPRPADGSLFPPGRVITMDLSGAGLNVRSGDVLAFALRSPESSFRGIEYQVGASSTNPYSRGAVFTFAPSLGLPEMTKNPQFDLAFTTYVTPAPVPEPGTILLLGTGIVGIASTLRKRLRDRVRD